MSRQQQIQQLLEHYFSTAWISAGAEWGPGQRAEIRELAEAICKAPAGWSPGVRGTGTCVCKFPPEAQESWAKRSGFENWLERSNRELAGAADLDHRCPKHGCAAQPDLWGRNKALTLHVQAKEWYSLGVKPNEPT
jgi:hypothetical protein